MSDIRIDAAERGSLRLAFAAAPQHLSDGHGAVLVLMEMPPMRKWFRGTNGQPGSAAYNRVHGAYRLHRLQVLEIGDDEIRRNSVFQSDVVFTSFGLAPTLSAS